MPKITVEEILRLNNEYEADFTASWTRQENNQEIIDGTYDVLKKKYKDFDPYHSPVHRANLNKTVERTVAYEPHPHVTPEGESQKAKDVANAMEVDSTRILDGFFSALNRAPWRDGEWLIEARGKTVFKWWIDPSYLDEGPERQKGESEDSFARRVADYQRRLAYGSAFIYEPIDPLRAIIHPPTLSVNPPWVIQRSEMDIFEVMQRWPHWSDPKQKVARKVKEPIQIIEYCDKDERGLLADEEPVTRIDKRSKGSIVPNEARRPYYDVLYSPYGQLPMMAGRKGRTREERMAVSQLDLLLDNIHAGDRVMSFVLLYLGRYGFPLPYGDMPPQEFHDAVDDGYLKTTPGGTIPGVLKQDPLPAYVSELQRRIEDERNYVTLPPVAVGLGTGISSGVQEAQRLGQVDLQALTTRKIISNAMARAVSECWYALKHVLPASSVSNITSVKREDIPDAPKITIDMEPPDENKRARKQAMADAQKDILPVRERLEAGGHEDTEKLMFEKIQDSLKITPEIAEFITGHATHLAEIRLILQQEKEALEKLSAPPPPPQPTAAPAGAQEGVPATVGMPGQMPEPGSPEEMAAMEEANMRMRGTPEGA